MAETMTLQKRKGSRAFRMSARQPAFASLSAGNFTAADLKATPLPAIGDLAGASAATPAKKKMTFKEVMSMASKRAFRGGAAGFAAGVIQVRRARRSPSRAEGRWTRKHTKSSKSIIISPPSPGRKQRHFIYFLS